MWSTGSKPMKVLQGVLTPSKDKTVAQAKYTSFELGSLSTNIHSYELMYMYFRLNAKIAQNTLLINLSQINGSIFTILYP